MQPIDRNEDYLGSSGNSSSWSEVPNVTRPERHNDFEPLTVRRYGGRKRAIGTRASMAIPQGPNQRLSLDFVSDTLSDGRRFRILCAIDV